MERGEVGAVRPRNAVPIPPEPPPDEETPDVKDILTSVLDELVNGVFGMNFTAGLIRFQGLLILFLITWSFFALTSHPLSNSSTPWPIALWNAYTSRDTLGHMIAISLPFWLAWRLAGIFLDDIYELKNTDIANKFIFQAAFVFPTYHIITIENGDVRTADKKSPIYNIGGPGRVRVSLENVALFEKIDGSPDLITPTTGNRWYTRTIDGFERLRQIIDVRDLTITITDLRSRTKDGIPISVQNIRLLFSVLRDPLSLTPEKPYTYNKDAILKLVYDQSPGPWTNSITQLVRGELIAFIAQHTLGEIFASVGEPEINRQIEKQSIVARHVWQHRNRSRRYRVQNQLRQDGQPIHVVRTGFVRRYPRRLNPRLSSRPMQRERRLPHLRYIPVRWRKRSAESTAEAGRIRVPHYPRGRRNAQALKFVPENEKFPRRPRYPLMYRPELLVAGPTPPFEPRPQLSRRFYQEFLQQLNEKNFFSRANERGLNLEWIDVGTWHTPSPEILRQNLEAWQLTTDNMVLSDRIVLNRMKEQAEADELLRLVRRPIYRFLELTRDEVDREEAVYALIEEYLGILRSARDEFMREGTPLPDRLLPAIDQIQQYQRAYIRRSSRGRYVGV